MDYFGEVKILINQHEFFGDERFVTYGRLDFLRQELTERLKDKNLSKPNPNWGNMWDNRFGAFLDLSDYVRGDRFINPSNVPNGQNFQNILQANDKYYEDGYICFREKNIILDMIRELENNINNRK